MSTRRRSAGHLVEQPELGLLVAGRDWPPHERFPYNAPGATVGARVLADLRASADPLVIVGYTSLDRLLDFVASIAVRGAGPRRVRVLLGHEPRGEPGEALLGRRVPLDREIEAYWLERGVSIRHGRAVLAALSLLEADTLQVRTSGDTPVHAKIYKGDNAVTIGSSNFSRAGLERYAEANVRFERDDGAGSSRGAGGAGVSSAARGANSGGKVPVDGGGGAPSETRRYEEAALLAETIWRQGSDYGDGFRALLEKLLRLVGWREALARGCAELLEGDWAARYVAARRYGEETELWPSQRQGIAQAMWVLENTGAVLVADATGSGKTRMGAHLIRALQMRNWRSGRARPDVPVIVCPPHVQDTWHGEATSSGQALQIYSHGLLSHRRARRHPEALRALRRAQVLAVDEAHNFLNRITGRTRQLYANMADHVVLFTATPINRGAHDLLAIIDLLGADNFEDDVLAVVERVWRRRRRWRGDRMSADELATIRRALARFVVRRTKRMLNRLVDREPERYRNALGQQCRYPEHVPHVYGCGEPERDRELAAEIRETAARLRGLAYLRSPLRLPPQLRAEGYDDARFLWVRLRAATALAAHQVAASLRSSRAALVEHVKGTATAAVAFHLGRPIKSTPTGDIVATVEAIRGRPPRNELDAEPPDWLADPDAHARACDEEVALYERIAELALALSAAREEAKAELLAGLLADHDVVIGFDEHLITLADLRERLERRGAGPVLVATGETDPRKLERRLRLGSELKGVVALCSDALAEGVNLQAASAVVLLDMPSVIRVIEQRIGRIDRMDSPHAAIHVHWPGDAPEYALRSDERFLERHGDVADLLGSNVPLPPELEAARAEADARVRGGSGAVVEAAHVIVELARREAESAQWDAVEDAFGPVRALVEGDGALVHAGVYEDVRAREERVLAAVSVVRAEGEWAFVALAGTEWGAPQWTWLERPDAEPVRDLETIARELRGRLQGEPEEAEFDDGAAARLDRVLRALERHEEALLPARKRRALAEMRVVLNAWRRDAGRQGDAERADVLTAILELVGAAGADGRTGGAARRGAFRPAAVDRNAVAEWWLDQVRPVWYRHLGGRRRRPARLRDIRRALLDEPLGTDSLRTLLDLPLAVPPLDQRVVAAIVAVPAG